MRLPQAAVQILRFRWEISYGIFADSSSLVAAVTALWSSLTGIGGIALLMCPHPTYSGGLPGSR